MKRNMEELYEKMREISRKTKINVVVGAAPQPVVDLELYSPKLNPCDYPVLPMRQLKRREVKEGAGQRFLHAPIEDAEHGIYLKP